MAIIVIDGPDGSGKTSTAQRLVSHMNAHRERFGGQKTVYYKSPAEPFGTMCKHLDSVSNLNPKARLLFFMAALQQDSQEVQALVDQGVNVVMDRFWHTTLAFHKVLAPETEKLFNTAGLISEDLNIILNADDTVLDDRILERAESDGTEISWWENQAFQKKLRHEFNRQARRDKKSLLIRTDALTPEEALHAILERLEDKFKKQTHGSDKASRKPHKPT